MSVVFLTFGYAVFAQRPSFEIANQAPPILDGLSVTPQTIQHTPITIAVNASDVSGVASVLAYIMSGANHIAVVTLYDDGSHSDNGASDGRYGNQWNVGDNPEGVYRVEIQANDRLGYATNRTAVTANFNIGGQGVSIVSPQNGDYLNGEAVEVRISAGGNTNVSEVRLFDGTTQVASRTTSGRSVNVTLSWPTNATQGSRTIHAEATVDGGTILSSASITVIVNQCLAGEPGFNQNFCTNLCSGLGFTCVAGGHNTGQPCGNPNLGYTYRGFDCSGNIGCCSAGGYNPGNTNTPVVLSTPAFVNPTSGETITTGDYTVNVQIQSSNPTYLAMNFYIDADLRGTQNWYSSNPGTNIYVYSQPMDLRGLNGSHTFRAVIYDRNNPGVTQEASVTVNINILAPTAEIFSPGEGELVSDVVPVLIQGAFASGVDKLELYDALNYGLIASLNIPTPDPNVLEVIDWDTSKYNNGQYSLYAIAYSGTNYGLSGLVNVVVNNVPTLPPTPEVTILTPKNDDKVSGVITVEISAANSGGNIELIELSELTLGLIGSVKPTTPSFRITEKIDWDTIKVENGDYYLQAVAISGTDHGKSDLVHVVVSN